MLISEYFHPLRLNYHLQKFNCDYTTSSKTEPCFN